MALELPAFFRPRTVPVRSGLPGPHTLDSAPVARTCPPAADEESPRSARVENPPRSEYSQLQSRAARCRSDSPVRVSRIRGSFVICHSSFVIRTSSLSRAFLRRLLLTSHPASLAVIRLLSQSPR